jgi:hypothetical protein
VADWLCDSVEPLLKAFGPALPRGQTTTQAGFSASQRGPAVAGDAGQGVGAEGSLQPEAPRGDHSTLLSSLSLLYRLGWVRQCAERMPRVRRTAPTPVAVTHLRRTAAASVEKEKEEKRERENDWLQAIFSSFSFPFLSRETPAPARRFRRSRRRRREPSERARLGPTVAEKWAVGARAVWPFAFVSSARFSVWSFLSPAEKEATTPT